MNNFIELNFCAVWVDVKFHEQGTTFVARVGKSWCLKTCFFVFSGHDKFGASVNGF
jgi:hypothetical protein